MTVLHVVALMIEQFNMYIFLKCFLSQLHVRSDLTAIYQSRRRTHHLDSATETLNRLSIPLSSARKDH